MGAKCAKFASKVEPQEDEDDSNAGKNPNAVARKCRDVICIAIFAVFWFGMFIVALLAMSTGDPYRLLYGSDYIGDACGGAGHTEEQITYYPRMNSDLLAAMQSGEMDPTKISLYGICVKECPQVGQYMCNYDVEEERALLVGEDAQNEFAEKNIDSWFDNGPCWYVPLPSDPVLFRCFPNTNIEKNETLRCIRPDSEGGGHYAYTAAGEIILGSPDLVTYYEVDKNYINGYAPNENCKTTEVETQSKQNKPTQPNPMLEQLNAGAAQVGRMFGDIQKTFSLIAINGGVLAVVFGFIFLLLLKYCAGVMVWVTVLSVVIICMALTAFCADKAGLTGDYIDSSALVAAGGLEVSDSMRAEADAEKLNVQNYKYLTYAMGGMTMILLVIIIFMRKKIKISIAIIREASNCVRKIPLMIIFPMAPFCMLFILVAYWVAIAALIQSGGGITLDDITAAADKASSSVGSLADSAMSMANSTGGLGAVGELADAAGSAAGDLAASAAAAAAAAGAALGASGGVGGTNLTYATNATSATNVTNLTNVTNVTNATSALTGLASSIANATINATGNRSNFTGSGTINAIPTATPTATPTAAAAASSAASGASGAVADADAASAFNSTNLGLAMSSLSPDETKKLVMAYHFFGFLWTMNLINAIQMCTIAGAVSSYYWARKKDASQIGHFPIAKAFYNCFRYHFGSLLFGSLIIAIVQFLRACLEYVDSKTKKLTDSNKFLKIMMKVVKCLMWCLEKVVKFVSKNAYIIVAMKGKSFCGATIDAFKLIFANIAQIGIISMISTLLLTLARISITASCAFITFNTITSDPRFTKGGELEVSMPMIPVVITTVVAFFISTVFMGVYGLAIDTILVCFCEDRKVNSDGTYYMSEELQKLIGAKIDKKKKKKGKKGKEEEAAAEADT
jgi:hypothetical protein